MYNNRLHRNEGKYFIFYHLGAGQSYFLSTKALKGHIQKKKKKRERKVLTLQFFSRFRILLPLQLI